MIQTQCVTEPGRVPDVEALVETDSSGGWNFSVFRYGGVVVLGADQYVRIGDGICFSSDEVMCEART